MTCVTGVSGSGKSTLVVDTLYRHVAAALQDGGDGGAGCRAVEGLDQVDRVIDIDQSPIGRTPRSNPATYTGLFGPIRELFAEVPEARARGYDPGRFSFNVRGGRCEACEGDGVIKVEMHFLPDAYVTCDACRGMRYNRETLEIRYKGRNISDVLDMTVEDAAQFFRNVPALQGAPADAARDRAVLRPARAERHHALGRRSAAREALARAREALDGPHALHPRRADDGAAFPRHRAAARRAAPPARRGQHHRRDRAQPRRDQDRGLGDRPRARGRGRRRPHRGDRHSRGRGAGAGIAHRAIPRAGARPPARVRSPATSGPRRRPAGSQADAADGRATVRKRWQTSPAARVSV